MALRPEASVGFSSPTLQDVCSRQTQNLNCSNHFNHATLANRRQANKSQNQTAANRTGLNSFHGFRFVFLWLAR
jgi:hypothetical protein